MNLTLALRGALVMIVVGTALGLAQNALSPNPVSWKPIPKTTLSLDDLVPDDPGTSPPTDDPVADIPAGDDPPTDNPAAESLADDGRAEQSAPVVDQVVEAVDPAGDALGESDGEVGGGDELAATETSPAEEDNPTPDEPAEPDLDEEPGPSPGEPEEPVADAGDRYADIPEAEFPFEVSLERAKGLYDRGGLLVLDAREHHEHTAGHIKGAESAPFDVMVGDIEWLDRTAADPRPLLVYCDGTDCEVSLNLGFEISQNGHGRVLILTGGYRAWADAGYPTTTGEQP